jgi:RNA-binding protein
VDLTPKQRRYLRSLAHHLDPVVQVGAAGLSEAVLAKVDAEMECHELIKVRVNQGCPLAPAEAGAVLARASGAGLVQVIGRVVILYRRRREEEPGIRLP